jgi:predicted metalloprotease
MTPMLSVHCFPAYLLAALGLPILNLNSSGECSLAPASADSRSTRIDRPVFAIISGKYVSMNVAAILTRAGLLVSILCATFAPSVVRAAGAYTWDDYLDRTTASLNQYWTMQPFPAGRTYIPAGLAWINETGDTVTACSTLTAAQGIQRAAFYCGLDRTVYISYSFVQSVDAYSGLPAVSQVIAHEWTHHVQNLLGVFRSDAPDAAIGNMPPREFELQADCVSGAYLVWSFAKSPLDGVALTKLHLHLATLGDSSGTLSDDWSAHGSGVERERAFDRGYASDPEWTGRPYTACNLPLRTPS